MALPCAVGLLATRNRPAFAHRAAHMFFAQCYEGPRRLYVYDDGESPFELCETLRAYDVTVVRHEAISLGEKRNRMLKYATARDPDGIFFMWDDDDFHGPFRLARQIGALLETPTADGCLFCPYFSYNTRTGQLFRARQVEINGLKLRVGADGTLALRRRLWERLPLDARPELAGINEGWRWLAEPHDRVIAVDAQLDYVVVRHGGNVTWHALPEEPADSRFWERITDERAAVVAKILAGAAATDCRSWPVQAQPPSADPRTVR